jgi:hypothetical protein
MAKKRLKDKPYKLIKYNRRKNSFSRASAESKQITEEHLLRAEEILTILSTLSNCKISDILVRTRKRKIVYARFIFHAIMLGEFEGLLYKSLGSFFPGKKPGNGQDRLTVYNASNQNIIHLEFDREYRVFSEKAIAWLAKLDKDKKAVA